MDSGSGVEVDVGPEVEVDVGSGVGTGVVSGVGGGVGLGVGGGVGELEPAVEPSPESDHWLEPSSFTALIETW